MIRGGAAQAERKAARKAALRELLARGERLKVAAHHVGVAYRTARRYRTEWR